MILPSLSVGDDAIIGAGSVVTRNVRPGATVAGNPAQQVCEHVQNLTHVPAQPSGAGGPGRTRTCNQTVMSGRL
jgi:serine acetyltransferase